MTDRSLLAPPLTRPIRLPFVGLEACLANGFVRMLLTALAYLLAAQAGKLLALPPGYSSPVWPAAGLALAALVKWGPRNWPGVWLGAFLFNLGLDVTPTGAAISALIAVGSTLQALLGARLTRQLYSNSEINTRSWNLLAAVLLRGPLVCLVASTIGIATLHGFGVVARAEVPHQWLAWTVGDILGVLLFTPLFVGVWPGRVDGGVRRARRMAVPLLVTAVLLTLGYFRVDHLNEERDRLEREAVATEFDSTGRQQLGLPLALLQNVERLFAASDEVTRAEFAAFTNHVAAHPGIEAMEWAPRVSARERALTSRVLTPIDSSYLADAR